MRVAVGAPCHTGHAAVVFRSGHLGAVRIKIVLRDGDGRCALLVKIIAVFRIIVIKADADHRRRLVNGELGRRHGAACVVHAVRGIAGLVGIRYIEGVVGVLAVINFRRMRIAVRAGRAAVVPAQRGHIACAVLSSRDRYLVAVKVALDDLYGRRAVRLEVLGVLTVGRVVGVGNVDNRRGDVYSQLRGILCGVIRVVLRFNHDLNIVAVV